MQEKEFQGQIDDINRKLDIVLEELHYQKQKREEVEDLMSDLTIVGKDAFKAGVEILDKADVQFDGEAFQGLIFKMMRNIDTLNDMFDMMESVNDLMKDAGPIVNQVGLDAVNKMTELDNKGYFRFLKELGYVFEKVVVSFTEEDLRAFADNVVSILETVKGMTQPEMLRSINNAVSVYKHMEMDEIPEYSVWKALREIRSPEMKKGIGFIMTFLKNLSKAQDN